MLTSSCSIQYHTTSSLGVADDKAGRCINMPLHQERRRRQNDCAFQRLLLAQHTLSSARQMHARRRRCGRLIIIRCLAVKDWPSDAQYNIGILQYEL